jgi:multiple sugar transport system substrate-binding protein
VIKKFNLKGKFEMNFRRIKKNFLLFSLILCVGFSLVACSSNNQGNSNVPETATLTMWTFLDPTATSPREVALKMIIENFEKNNPNIKIKVEPQQWDKLSTKFLAAAQSGSAPDIIWNTAANFGAILESGQLADFESLFLKNWSANDIADVNDSLWNHGVKGGKHYQYTVSRNFNGAIIYRKDLLEQKGIKLPFKTIDELISAAKKLTGKDPATGNMVYGFGEPFGVADSPQTTLFQPLLVKLQGDLYTKEGKANWSTDAGVKAMKTIIDMVEKDGVTPQDSVSTTGEQLINQFMAGKFAMIIGPAVRIPQLQAGASFDGKNIAMTFIPSYDGSSFSPGMSSGWSVSVWKGSKHKEAAGKFVEALISKDSDKIWVETGKQVPNRRSTSESLKDFLNKPENEFLRKMQEGVSEYGYLTPAEYQVQGIELEVNKAIQQILTKGTDIKTALKAAEESLNSKNQH